MSVAVSSTTLTSAITSDSTTTIRVAAVPAVGDFMVVGNECMKVNGIDATALTAEVQRGWAGTKAQDHADADKVWHGAPNRFKGRAPTGVSEGAASEEFEPWIHVSNLGVDIYIIGEDDRWMAVQEGTPGGNRTALRTYTAAGAIAIEPGIHHLLGGGVLAMTLAAPAEDDDGMEIKIVDGDGNAYTVTAAAPEFNEGVGNVGTFGGAVGDSITCVAVQGGWLVTSNINVTIA